MVAGYADAILIGEVLEAQANKDNSVTTTFRVKVLQTIKGPPYGTVLIRQHGGVFDNGTWELEAQPLLVVGDTYLLTVTKAEADEMFLISGPISATRVNSPEQISTAVADWRDHVRQQRDPGIPKS